MAEWYPTFCKVFSTSVEVFLNNVFMNNTKVSLLHVRGGVSDFGRN